MSGVAEAVRAFLDLLERGEGTEEDRALANQLAFWASGWKARGAVAPVSGNGQYPAVAYGVPFEQAVVRRELSDEDRARFSELVATPSAEVSPKKKRDRPFGHNLQSALFGHFLALEPPAEVVAVVDPPARWSKPGAVSVPDLEFAELLRRDYAGEWVEVRTEELTWTQRHWLAQKVTGSGAAYRPSGSFEAKLVREGAAGRLFVRAIKEATDESVPVEPAPAVAPGTDWDDPLPAIVAEGVEIVGEPEPVRLSEPVLDEAAGSKSRPQVGRDLSIKRRQEHSAAPSKAVAVIDPPAPASYDRPRPKPGETWPEWTEFAEAIRAYGGKWVEIEVSDRNAAGRGNLATAIRGQYNAFRPAGDFEATVQGGRLYARWRKGSKRG